MVKDAGKPGVQQSTGSQSQTQLGDWTRDNPCEIWGCHTNKNAGPLRKSRPLGKVKTAVHFMMTEPLSRTTPQFSSVPQSFPTLQPNGLQHARLPTPVHHQLLELTQTHVPRVGPPPPKEQESINFTRCRALSLKWSFHLIPARSPGYSRGSGRSIWVFDHLCCLHNLRPLYLAQPLDGHLTTEGTVPTAVTDSGAAAPWGSRPPFLPAHPTTATSFWPHRPSPGSTQRGQAIARGGHRGLTPEPCSCSDFSPQVTFQNPGPLWEVPRRIQEGTLILFIERLHQAQDWTCNRQDSSNSGRDPSSRRTDGRPPRDR